MARVVSSSMSGRVLGHASVELQVAVAGDRAQEETLDVTIDGQAVPLEEVRTEAGGRLHCFDAWPGMLEVSYRARVDLTGTAPPPVRLDEVSRYRRPSRYAQSDRLASVAAAEFGSLRDPADLVRAVPAWVSSRLAYVLGSSTFTDSAVETLATGNGVCRDFAHVTLAMLRARDVPARLVAVYAPGLHPMDFHAVVEVAVDGFWYVVDATGLAPRGALVRIATGRDAADTAFLSNYGADIRLERLRVAAELDGETTQDDPDALVPLA